MRSEPVDVTKTLASLLAQSDRVLKAAEVRFIRAISSDALQRMKRVIEAELERRSQTA